MDLFKALNTEQYKGDKDCSDLITAALSQSDPSKCPAGGAGPGSPVQKCMSKTPGTAKAWVSFVRTCEVMNVANRAGEAEAATELKPSCFPAFNGMSDFEAYVGGAASAAGMVHVAAVTLVAVAAGALAIIM